MPLSYKFLLFFHFYYQYQNPPDTSYIVEETIWYLRITNLSERKLLSWLIIWNTKSLNNIFFLTYFVSVIIICQPLVQGTTQILLKENRWSLFDKFIAFRTCSNKISKFNICNVKIQHSDKNDTLSLWKIYFVRLHWHHKEDCCLKKIDFECKKFKHF